MTELIFYRGSDEFIRIKIDESTQTKEIGGQNTVNLSFKDSRYINFRLGDYIRVFPGTEWEEVYKINRPPMAHKEASIYWEYSFTVESEAYDLAKVSFMGLDSGNNLTEPEHSLMGDAGWHLKLLLQNIHRIDPDFELGEILPTTAKLITYSRDNCYNALVKMAEAFGTEFWVRGKKISLTKVQSEKGRLYMQGQNKGLYTITREAIEERNIATRLYAYGSDKNLPFNYLSKRLRLPVAVDPKVVSNVMVQVVPDLTTIGFNLFFTPPTAPGVTDLQVEFRVSGSTDPFQVQGGSPISPRYLSGFDIGTMLEVRFVTVMGVDTYTTPSITVFEDTVLPELPAPHTPYLEKNTDLYGVIEHTEYFDDIYPGRVGTVTGVDATDPFKLVDTDIDFDINEYLINSPAKLTFNTGQLAGYTFNLQSYDHATTTVIFLKNSDEKALDVPNEYMRPAIGDAYVITDIMMPQEYITDAENRLLAEAEKFLAICSVPQVRYKVAFDPTYLRRRGYMPVIGELIWIKDEQFNIERKIRVVATSRSIVNEWDVTVTLSDVVAADTWPRINREIATNGQTIQQVEQYLANRDVLNNRMSLPVFGSDAEAGAAGLKSGMLYRTATGEVRIKL